MVTKKMVCKI